MKHRHFEALKPLCPVCRTAGGGPHRLKIATVQQQDDRSITEGTLHCTNPRCLREYPIIDGIPIIIADIRAYLSENILPITARRDLSESTESILGDCTGPGSLFNTIRQHLSSYAWDHYGDLDPGEPSGDHAPGSVLRTLNEAWSIYGATPAGPVIDLGCSVGRTSFALAERHDELVLGVDMSFPMLRVAAGALNRGTVCYPKRRVGLVYERREFPVRFDGMENVDFWACDAAALPFADGTFSAATAMNTLDCIYSPTELLASLARVLKTDAKAILTCPYDWSPAATPIEAWLGGHSQRSQPGGDSAAILRSLLTPGAHPSSIAGLELFAEKDLLPWHVRMHDRSTVSYKAHLVVARATGAGNSTTA